MAFTRVHKLAKAAPILKSAVKPLVSGKVEDWHGEYAYSLGLQAFIYGFPYIYNAQTRHKWVTQPRNPKFVPYAALNEFWHAAQLMDATYRDGGAQTTTPCTRLRGWMSVMSRSSSRTPTWASATSALS